ncbi:hypothetical protein [Salininema proteolyticum]|uniref:Uncharacterized protein n=1 Tax=Salininema proteolyticum TaxID=1607685 RepID=A0ABV8TXR8_9ACTN
MAAKGIIGGDPSKLDRVNTVDEAGPVLRFDLVHPDATAIEITAANDHTADTLLTYWTNNSGQAQRTGYLNEKGEIRSRPGSPATVPVRVQQRDERQSGDLQQWTDAGNTPFSRIDADGYATLRVDAWTALDLEPGVVSDAAEVRRESAYGIARLRGTLTTQLTGFNAGSTIATVPAPFRPIRTVVVTVGFDSTQDRTMTVTPAGAISLGSSIGAGDDHTIHLDGVTWELA